MSDSEIKLLSESFGRALFFGVDRLQTDAQRLAVAQLHREFCEARSENDLCAMRQKRERLNEFILPTDTP